MVDTHVVQSCLAPPLELPLEGMRLPERADGAPEEVADLAPATSQRTSCEWQSEPDVELPERPRDPARNAELERGDDSSGANDAPELHHGRGGIGHVAQEVREREVVEGGVLERQLLRGRLHELDRVSEPSTCLRQHLRASVDSRDLVSAAQELRRDQPRSGGNVQDVAARGNAGDEEPPPAGVLAEREHPADTVVRRPQRGEQLLGIDRAHEPILGDVALGDELERIRELAGGFAGPGDVVSGILAAEPTQGRRAYICSFDDADGLRSWLALRADGAPIVERAELRAAVSIAAICEIAAEAAGGRDLDEVLTRLTELRAREAPDGIEHAEAAARELRSVLGEPPQLATPVRLDAIGAAARRLEQELSPNAASPFVAAMRASEGTVGELQREIEAGYRLELE